ncbi:MAG: hypothetical protein QOE71_256 [Pseudonocardiales bacterium]|nr:hypothetical protein [Pseudonocardiales bacterium]
MWPRPDCGEDSYKGSGKLTGKATVIIGAASGIGRAVAIAYARERANVPIAYLEEDQDKVDVLVNNAAFQMSHESLQEIPDEEWDYTFATYITAMFHLCKAAVPHMARGSAIIGSSSVNSDLPSPTLAPYAATKAAIANFCASLAQLLGPRGIRVNSVASGPIWTPLIPATMPKEKVENFGKDVPLGRPGQPAELAPVYVLLASDDGSYISGARVAVTAGRPIL